MKVQASRIDLPVSYEADARYVPAGAILFAELRSRPGAAAIRQRLTVHPLPAFQAALAPLVRQAETAPAPAKLWAYFLERGLGRFSSLSVPLELEGDDLDEVLVKAWARWRP